MALRVLLADPAALGVVCAPGAAVGLGAYGLASYLRTSYTPQLRNNAVVATALLVAAWGLRRVVRSLSSNKHSSGKFVAFGDRELFCDDLPSIALVTGFEAENEAAYPLEYLRERVARITQANLWIAGRLRTNPVSGQAAIWVPESPPPVEEMLEVVTHADENANIADIPGTPVVCGKRSLDKPNAPLCKFILQRSRAGKSGKIQFSITVVMSHMVADSATVYALHSMLDPESKVWTMRAEREEGWKRVFLTTLGRDGALRTWWFIFSCGIGPVRQLFRPPPRETAIDLARRVHVRCSYVKQSWVDEQKALVSTSQEAPFISSNDLLASWFFKQSNAAAGVVPMNMRGKLPGLTRDLAGNYLEMLILFEGEYGDPQNIRCAVNSKGERCHLSSKVVPLPRGRDCGIVTNLTQEYAPINLPGCTEVFHLPRLNNPDTATGVAPLPVMVVYKTTGGRIAVITRTARPLSDTGPLGEDAPGAHHVHI